MKNLRQISAIVLFALTAVVTHAAGLSTPSTSKPVSEDLKLFKAPASLSASGKAGYLAYDATYFYVYDPVLKTWNQYGGGGGGGSISDTAYNATTWDSVTTTAPSKNAVRDQIETMLTSIAAKLTVASPSFTSLMSGTTSIAADTFANGIALTNPNAATSTTARYSPFIEQEGFGWKTASTAASQSVKFRFGVQPSAGFSSPNGMWLLQRSTNGGAWTTAMSVDQNGGVAFGANIVAGTGANVYGDLLISLANGLVIRGNGSSGNLTLKQRTSDTDISNLFLSANGADKNVIFTADASVGGTNTGDQNLFGSMVVSGQTTVTPGSTAQALTLVAGSNMTITTDNTAKSITFAATGGSGVGGNPTGTVGLTGVNGVASTFLRSDGAPPLSQSIAPTWTGVHAFAPTARSSGVASYFTITPPTDTGITASTESVGYTHAAATRTWATTGTVALQRERFFAGPTYGSASASQTFTDVFNMYLTPPVAGTNAIFTRGHTFGIVDATSASSSITGGLIVATTLGTAGTSVGIGGGNVNAGGLITGGTMTSTGAFNANGTATFTPAARSTGAASFFTLTTPADTNQTLSTEAIGLNKTAATRQWATGALTTQREVFFGAPTYGFVGASTLTTAINVDIADPVAGTNATFTNTYGLRAGNVLFTGLIKAGSSPTTLTDSAGKILSAALNTVAVAQGGTGATSGTVAFLGNAQVFTVPQTFTPGARATGALPYFILTTPADTNQTLSTEAIGASFTAATRQWATGTLALQRERVFAAPTYGFVGASTLTTAINVDIADPIAGTNATFTNGYALRAGKSLFTGKVITVASATGSSGFNLPHGAAPTSPVDGDLWSTTTGFSGRVNGVTQNLLPDNGTLNAGTIAGATNVTGTSNYTPETITITTNAGVVDVTKPQGSATNGAATTLTFSTDNVASQRLVTRKLINSDASNARVWTFDTVTDFTVTVPASSSVTLTLASNGASGWAPFNASASNMLDLTADTTPAITKLMETVDATTGVSKKSTISQIVGAAANATGTFSTQTPGDNSTKGATTGYADAAALAAHLGTFASPNTAAGSITWTAPVYDIYTSASGALRTYTLPAASSYTGKAFILYVVAGTNHVNVQPASGAQLVLAGTLLTANHYAQAATSGAGNYIAFRSDGTNWISLGFSGTWADATSP
jgi:hypothetical protein